MIGPINDYPVLKAAPGGLSRQLARFYVPDLRTYSERDPGWACPHCQHALPPNIIDTPCYVLGIVGARAAGKSHYIGTLVHTLLNDSSLHYFGISDVIAATNTVARHYDQEYYQPFFAERAQLSPTAPVSALSRPHPLIYTISFRSEPGKQSERLNLVLLDYAGEDFTNEQSLAGNVRFLPYADGLVLLIDPLTMPGTKNRLPLHMQQDIAAGVPAATVLENVIRVLRRSTQPGTDGLLKVPLVLAVSKADLLRYMLPNLGRHPLRDSADGQIGFDPAAFIARGELIRTFCREANGPRLDDLAHAFRVHTYSTISATGRSIDRTGFFGRTSQEIHPQRCLDPLLWLLNQRRQIRSR